MHGRGDVPTGPASPVCFVKPDRVKIQHLTTQDTFDSGMSAIHPLSFAAPLN
jgi:hypothetical protein